MSFRSLRLWVGAMAVVGLTLTAGTANAGYINLTTSGSSDTSGTFGGALFAQGATGSGTGVFPSFAQIGAANQGVVQGYNTTANGVFDNQSSDQHNREIKISDLQIATIGGVQYYKFALDINETGNDSDRYLSLDSLQFYTSTTPNQNTTNVSTLGTLRYDMGPNNGILLDASASTGSGTSDLFVYIKTTNFAGSLSTDYVYLYSKFGALGSQTNGPGFAGPTGDYGNSDGFEEWSIAQANGREGGQDVVTPAPAGLVLLASAAPFALLLRRLRRQPAVA